MIVAHWALIEAASEPRFSPAYRHLYCSHSVLPTSFDGGCVIEQILDRIPRRLDLLIEPLVQAVVKQTDFVEIDEPSLLDRL